MSSKVIGGRYELREKIGDGGMAIVYKAMDRLLNRFVAVKILRPEFTRDAKFIENFRRESHAAASLTHPNIVQVYDVGREGNINYIVMELVEGKVLSDMINEEGAMPYKEVSNIIKQIAAGLSAAHKHGIIHRDVKPHNVLVNEEGVAKITDFGIAKAVSAATIIDETGKTIMGSVHYFSPEQAKGEKVDEKSDIYSLGIVMYEMLTGEVPYDGDNPVSVALMHVNERVGRPSDRVAGIPAAVDNIVLKATSKDPEKRFRSAEEVIRAIDEMDFATRTVTPVGIVDPSRQKLGPDENLPTFVEDIAEKNTGNDAKKKRKKKILIAVGIIAALAAVFVVFALVSGIFKKDVEVPDLRGMTYEEAQDACEDVGLKLKQGKLVYSEDYDAGEVAEQSPKAGRKIKEGKTVTVNLSKGAEEGTVPNLIGLDEKEAKEMIEEYGFKVGDVKEKASDEEEGTVIGQDPDPGEKVDSGSVIDLVVSNGEKETVTMSDLRGMSESEAEAAIQELGLKVGSVDYDSSSKYSEGTVMSQSPSAGSKVEKGSSVDIVISRGASSTVNLYVDYSSAKQETFYMTITVTDSNGTRNVVSNEKRNRSDQGETVSIKGTGSGKIVVTFDNTTVMNQSVNFATGELN